MMSQDAYVNNMLSLSNYTRLAQIHVLTKMSVIKTRIYQADKNLTISNYIADKNIDAHFVYVGRYNFIPVIPVDDPTTSIRESMKKRVFCEVCKVWEEDMGKFLEHCEDHPGGKCRFCQKTCRNMRQMLEHMDDAHYNTPSPTTSTEDLGEDEDWQNQAFVTSPPRPFGMQDIVPDDGELFMRPRFPIVTFNRSNTQ